MIKLESVHIEEIRGIRMLDIRLNRQNFAISGPNGSGKSCVIDAIEFGLTGEIKRLTGSGTKRLSVAKYGPHVDCVESPDASFVELHVYLPTLGKSAIIKRSIENPKKPVITPDEPEVLSVLETVAVHPEITLSRRDIIQFILTEPAKRSQEIQTLLKLGELGDTRSVLNTVQNRLHLAHTQAQAASKQAEAELVQHLQTERFDEAKLLSAVNEKRMFLGLEPIKTLSTEIHLDKGLDTGGTLSRFNKELVITDISALKELISGLKGLGAEDVTAVLDSIRKIERDAALFVRIQRRALIEKGLELLDGPYCPLCDLPWESEDHLREHLSAKLGKSEEASVVKETLSNCGTRLSQLLLKINIKLAKVIEIARLVEVNALVEATELDTWRTDLTIFIATLASIDGLIGQKERFVRGWLNVPKGLTSFIANLEVKVQAVPDQSNIVAAQTYLSNAQLRYKDFQKRLKDEHEAKKAARASKRVYEVYCRVLEDELNSLYEKVQNDFSEFYRELNEGDEDTFTAKLIPSEKALELDVDFYERGLFPPGAYHSEGHQDGMGVCLYLALMKQLFRSQFSLTLLDDVVMSVDVGHRYQFCKLLKAHFPDTQFVMTTHDRLWAEQMKSAGLVTSKTSLTIHGWSVDGGPIVESSQNIWEEIVEALNKGKIGTAASLLRHHLEYFATQACDQLGARPQFRADGRYELGDILPAARSRLKDILGKAADAAQSWGNDEKKQAVGTLKEKISASWQASQGEQWAVNNAVHYNSWANFAKKDFEPVVTAFKKLLDLFHCKTCGSLLYANPKTSPEALRCSCGTLNFNLNKKPN